MVTEKNSSIGLFADNNNNMQTDETSFNFALSHAAKMKLNELEYDDNIDIDTVDD